MSNKQDKKGPRDLCALSANSLNDAALAVAIQSMEKAKKSARTAKQALEELNISVPDLINVDWDLLNFRSLVEIKVVSVKDHNDSEIPILNLIERKE